jgi:5-carboxymethyl-2-hydroxymuconate isomerase
MPQITVEYSRNLEARVDVVALVHAIHEAARSTGLFEQGYGIRTRAAPRDVYVIADTDPANAFVAVVVRIAEGRTASQKEKLADRVFGALRTQTADALASTRMALSVEIQDIAELGARNHNTLRPRPPDA